MDFPRTPRLACFLISILILLQLLHFHPAAAQSPPTREVLFLIGSSPPAEVANPASLTDDGPLGFSAFNAMASAMYFHLVERLDRDTTLDQTTLAPFKELILASNNRRFSPTEQQAVVDFVNNGGGVLAFSDAQFGFNEAPASDNDIFDHFNLHLLHDNYSDTCTVNQFTETHFLTQGLTFQGEGVSAVRVLGPPARLLARLPPDVLLSDVDGPLQASDGALGIAEVGRGRVAATFDRNTFLNPPGAGTDINLADNRVYAQRLLRWLAGESWAAADPAWLTLDDQ